jgi:hypothetical protein
MLPSLDNTQPLMNLLREEKTENNLLNFEAFKCLGFYITTLSCFIQTMMQPAIDGC